MIVPIILSTDFTTPVIDFWTKDTNPNANFSAPFLAPFP